MKHEPITAEAFHARVTSRLQILWETASATWPPKYRNAIATCLDTAEPFDREAVRKSGESK